jgi:hypothetical protein
MTTNHVAVRAKNAVARPLKVLVPLIKDELEAGDHAGLEHYRRAGQMLVEAKDQMPWGNWGKWLSKNFALSDRTALRYMRLSAIPSHVTESGGTRDYSAIIGERPSREQVSGAWRKVTQAARELDAELFSQERQSVADEIQLRRDLFAELVDLGYKALATRLHPDRGGSKDAMARLNAIREQGLEIAKTRRWV